jgi:hypothetical protein
VWFALSDARSRHVVDVAEEYADGLADDGQLEAAKNASYSVHANISPSDSGFADSAIGMSRSNWEAVQGATMTAMPFSTTDDAIWCCQTVTYQAALAATCSAQEEAPHVLSDYVGGAAEANERTGQAHLIRCIFGSIFRSVSAKPFWVSWNEGAIKALAQRIYIERAFDRLPILADALEDAGCDNVDILTHCRQPGEHVRGCWVVDLLLGKS